MQGHFQIKDIKKHNFLLINDIKKKKYFLVKDIQKQDYFIKNVKKGLLKNQGY